MTYISSEQQEDKAYGCFNRFPVSGESHGLLYIMISIHICSEQAHNELKLQPLNPTQHWSFWRLWVCRTPVQGSQAVDLPRPVVLEMLPCLNLLRDPPVQGSQEFFMPRPPRDLFSGGRPASICLGVRSPGGCHASACLGICTLTQGCLALRLQQ